MRGWVASGYFPSSMMVMAPGAGQWQALCNLLPQLGSVPPTASAPAPAPPPPAPMLLAVTCPGGVFAGHKIMTRAPNGTTLEVVVPPGIMPGMTFHIQCPP
jgi:hypothetical protein